MQWKITIYWYRNTWHRDLTAISEYYLCFGNVSITSKSSIYCPSLINFEKVGVSRFLEPLQSFWWRCSHGTAGEGIPGFRYRWSVLQHAPVHWLEAELKQTLGLLRPLLYSTLHWWSVFQSLSVSWQERHWQMTEWHVGEGWSEKLTMVVKRWTRVLNTPREAGDMWIVFGGYVPVNLL